MKLDLGCGPNKKDGFVGLDQYAFPGVDHVLALGRDVLPFGDGSVDEIHASHFIEHLTAPERCFLLNEAYRVMQAGAKMTMIVPHFGSNRAYGDPTHQWPPIGEFWFFYLNKEWRATNAPHTDKKNWPLGYDCHFEVTWGYSPNPAFASRHPEFVTFAINHYREGALDIIATLTKR